MKPTLSKTPRSERKLEYYFGNIMESVVDVFLVCAPEYDRASFIRDIFSPLNAARVSGDDVLRRFHQTGQKKLYKGEMALLACIYCIESGWARLEGRTELAWSCLMEAQQYRAMALAADVSEPQLARILDLARIEAKSKAGQENAAVGVRPWRETRQEAIRLIEEKARNGQQWTSAEQAAVEILDDLKEFLKTRQSKKQKDFWTTTPERTVARWLRGVSNAESLFGHRHIDKKTK